MEGLHSNLESQVLTALTAIATKPRCSDQGVATVGGPIHARVRDTALEAFDLDAHGRDPFASFDLEAKLRN